MNDANVRQQIFDALNDALAIPGDPAPAPPVVAAPALTSEAKIARLTELMTAIRTEVHQTTADAWLSLLQQVLTEKKPASGRLFFVLSLMLSRISGV